MKYSAAAMFEFPDAESSPVADTATPGPPLVTLGVSSGDMVGRTAGVGAARPARS